MKDKRINLLLMFSCFLAFTDAGAQTLTLECGRQKQAFTNDVTQTSLEFFESDTLHLRFTDKSVSTDSIAGDILIVPKTGNSRYEKSTGKKPFIVTGMLQMHNKKILAEQTKIIVTVKRKNYPDKRFCIMII